MELIKIKICNFRSFGEEQTIAVDDLTTIIGNNSSGKTAALVAINKIFSQNSGDRVLQRSDFHLPKDKKPEDVDSLELYVEAVFAFKEVLSEDYEKSNAIPLFFQSMIVDSPSGVPLLRIRLIAKWERSSNFEGSIDSKICYITCPEDEEITEDDVRPAGRKELDSIRVIYVPAVRDPSKQLKNVSGTMIHQLLGSVKWSDQTKEDVQRSIQELNDHFIAENGVSIINESIHNQWINYDSDDRYSNAVLRFNSTDIESSIKNSEVYFSPTVTEKEYTIDEMGDGLRSLFYISMVNSILDVETIITKDAEDNEAEDRAFLQIPPVLSIIAIEEPENHISPHLLGKLVNNLNSISEKKNAQVILTSHSPAIVKRIETENIRYFRMQSSLMSTRVHKICLPDKESMEEQYKYIKEAVRAYPEIYFAKMVVLGEGDSEEIILPKYLEVYGDSLDPSGISVVPLGGRYVNHFWRLLSDLKIPYVTLLDLDREREGGGWGRIKYAFQQLLKVGILDDDSLHFKDGQKLSELLANMHNWPVKDVECMNQWISTLEDYNVFYAGPLDIDFLMLEEIGSKYVDSLGENEGPMLKVVDENGEERRVSIKNINMEVYLEEYKSRLESDIKHTLKKEGGEGITYNSIQKEWMIWYTYFFLNRGKPTTHIAVLSKMSDMELRENTPDVIRRLIEKVHKILSVKGGSLNEERTMDSV